MPQSDVHVGRDGWLFLVKGSNDVLSQYRRTPLIWWRLRRWRRRIEARAERCRRLGVLFVQVVVPEKLTMLPHFCERPLIDPAFSPASRLSALMARSKAASAYVDLVGPLRAATSSGEMFLRTDTHWTYGGCLVAYRRLCEALDAAPRDDLHDRPYQDLHQRLDLGSKLVPPIEETLRLHTTIRDARQHAVNQLVVAYREAGGAAPVGATAADYRNDAPGADPRRVLIFGDSYSHFDPVQLTGMLAETFRDVRFVWSTEVDWRYVDEVGPDVVICEMAERFMSRVADDRFDLRAAVAERLAEDPRRAKRDGV